MGLGTYLHKKKIESDREKIIRKLTNEEREYEEIGYWRKDSILNDWFLSELDVGNCEEAEVSKEQLEKFINYLKGLQEDDEDDDGNIYNYEDTIKEINEIIKETDWEKEQIFFYAWW